MIGYRPARAIVRTGATLYNREDSKFSGRAGLIYNFANGLAPYVSYATSYNPIIGLNASNQLFLPETGEQAEIGLKFQPNGFNGHFGIAVFDLKRQNVPTTVPNITPTCRTRPVRLPRAVSSWRPWPISRLA